MCPVTMCGPSERLVLNISQFGIGSLRMHLDAGGFGHQKAVGPNGIEPQGPLKRSPIVTRSDSRALSARTRPAWTSSRAA